MVSQRVLLPFLCAAAAAAAPNSTALGASARPAVSLALAGGGFRAVASDVGLTVGLLSVLGKTRGQSAPTLVDSGLFRHFDAISSVSGGSWFTAELAYSNGMVSLVEGMAASPATAGQQFGERWTSKWLSTVSSPRSSNFVRSLKDLLTRAGLQGWSEMVDEVGYFMKRGLSWEQFTRSLLSTTAGLDADLPLGAPVTAWARGKAWLVGHSMVTPSGQHDGTLWELLAGFSSATYTVRHPASAEAPPVYVPAAFSVTLGAGPSAPAPLPYTPCHGALASDTIEYTGSEAAGFERFTASSTAFGSFAGLAEDAGLLPVSDVVAASSAALGGLCISSLGDAVNTLLGGGATPWVSSARGGAAFADGSALVNAVKEAGEVSRGSLDAIAASQVRGVIDGAYTDNTGIGHAVAAGAREVVAVLNNGDDSSIDTENMFLGLFKGGPGSSNLAGVPLLRFPIFAEPAGSIRQQQSSFPRLVLPSGSRYLTRVSVGTVHATTAESKWFGIEAGQPVTLHVVTITSAVSMGQFADFAHYNVLVQEIVDCVTSAANAGIVRGQLLKWMVPESRRLIAV